MTLYELCAVIPETETVRLTNARGDVIATVYPGGEMPVNMATARVWGVYAENETLTVQLHIYEKREDND